MSDPTPPPFRAGIAAIVGRANSGKSSLLNALLGEQVSVVSPVAQTTRRPVRGILNEDHLQVVFLDTPGIRQASHSLSSMLNRTARGLVTGSDAVVLLFDASIHPQDEDRGWMKKLSRESEPIFAVLNKSDLGLRRRAYEEAWAEVIEKNRAKDPDFSPPPSAGSKPLRQQAKACPNSSTPSARPCPSPRHSFHPTCSRTTPNPFSSPMSFAPRLIFGSRLNYPTPSLLPSIRSTMPKRS